MLNIGKKYFDLDQIPNLKILRLSAERYVLRADEVFDFVLVDLYLGDQVPSFVYSKNFLDQLGQLGQLVIINHLFYDDSKRQKAEELLKKLKAIFKKIELVRVLTNLVIIAKHV